MSPSGSGKVSFTDSLLKAGADIDRADNAGITPLDVARYWDYPAVTVRLLDAGAILLEVAEAEEFDA